MLVSVTTDICAGYPTPTGNIYTKSALKELCARAFNPGDVPGKFLKVAGSIDQDILNALAQSAERSPQMSLISCSVINNELVCNIEIDDLALAEIIASGICVARLFFEDKEIDDDRQVVVIGKVRAIFVGDYTS